MGTTGQRSTREVWVGLAGLSLVVVGCGGGSVSLDATVEDELRGRRCGNGVCSRYESCASCPGDCGVCAAADGAIASGMDGAIASAPDAGANPDLASPPDLAPVPPVSMSDGGTVAGSYATDFDKAEAPISEGGRWHRAKNVFTDVVVENGVAHGTNGAANAYDDSYALLSGFGPNQQVEAVVQRSSQLVTGITHEVELLLRFSDDAGNARGYECLFAYFGGVQAVRWNGPIGDFTVLPTTSSNSLGRELATGDVLRATIVGTTIRLYVNGLLLGESNDSGLGSGQPGMGFFTRPGGNSAHLALTRYTATTLP